MSIKYCLSVKDGLKLKFPLYIAAYGDGVDNYHTKDGPQGFSANAFKGSRLEKPAQTPTIQASFNKS